MSRKVLFDWPFASSRPTESSMACGRIVVGVWSGVCGAMVGDRRFGWSSCDRVAVS